MSENATENVDHACPNIVTTVTRDRDETPSTAVIDAVADAADVDPADLGTPLYDVIDPDALDNLFSDRHNGMPRANGHVSFSLLGYDVTVYSGGQVVVRE